MEGKANFIADIMFSVALAHMLLSHLKDPSYRHRYTSIGDVVVHPVPSVGQTRSRGC